jgi:uncharacterized protein
MKIFVKAKAGAKEEKVEKISETEFLVRVKEPAQKGRANHAIIAALANYFSLPHSRVRLVSGFSAKQKVFEIML